MPIYSLLEYIVISKKNQDRQIVNEEYLDVPGFGNCFFHALSMAYKNLNHSHNIRALIVQYVCENFDNLPPKFELLNSDSGVRSTSAENYRKLMSRIGEYAEEFEAVAFSYAFQRPVCIIDIFYKNMANYYALLEIKNQKKSAP